MIKGVLILVMMLGSCASKAGGLELDTKDRYLEVIDVVDASVIKAAQKLDRMSRESAEDITILINSPGGFIAPGFIFVDAMEAAKSRGVTLKCISGVVAASMAFIMLAHCNERYVLRNTMLLFHPVSFSGDSIRITEVLPSLMETEKRERLVGAYLMEQMGLSWREYHPHNFSETLWTGKGLSDYTDGKFVTVVKSVDGLPNLFQHQRKGFNLFGQKRDALEMIPAKLHTLYK